MSTDAAAELLLSGAAVLLLTHSSRIIQRSTRGARWTSPYSPATSNATTSIVLLWVAASLQHNALAIQTNAVFASCLLVVVVGPVAPTTRVLRTPVTDANFPTATADYAPTAVSLPSRYQWWARTSVSVTPTALWTSLFFDTTTRPWYNPTSTSEPVGRVFVALCSGVATWVMLMAWHYYRYRRRKPPAQLHYGDAGSTFGTPWNVTEHTNKQSMEQHWYQWTVYETIVWMEDVVRQQQQQTNDDYETPFDVATFLGPEQIHGYQLPQLTTRDLTVLGIPMGTALGITKAIVQLLQQHPGPNGSLSYGNQSDSTVYPTIRTTDWLAQHDAEYNCVNIRAPPVQTYPQPTSLSNSYSAAPTHYQSTDQPQQQQQQQQQQQRPLTRETADLPDDAQERAQRVMRDRYGLELPAFRTATVCTDSGGDTVSPGTYRNDDSQIVPPTTGAVPPDGPVPSSSAPVHLTQSNSNGRAPPSPSATTLPSDFIANLPPHIADILRQKPDLVAQVLRSHRRATHRNDGAQAVVPQSFHETSLPLDSSVRETHSPGADNNDVGDVESTPLLADTPSAWGADNNQETAELLRKRRTPIYYKSLQ